MAGKVRRKNPSDESVGQRTFAAIGLGAGVVSVGLAIGNLHRKPSISLGAVVLGFGLTLAYLPWGHYGGNGQ